MGNETIKKKAQDIIIECERIERLEDALNELTNKKEFEYIKLYKYVFRSCPSNFDVSLSSDQLSKKSIEKIQNFIIGIIKEELGSQV